MIQDFSHVTISCTNIERSTRFYEALGLTVTRRVGEMDSPGVAAAFALPRGHLTVTHLAPAHVSGKMVIDLVQWLDPEPEGRAYPSLNNLGLTRLAFRVDDIDGTAARLREVFREYPGVRFLSDAVQEFGRGVRSIAFTDPDGTILQLIQGLDAMPA